jgi:hypothetical protein
MTKLLIPALVFIILQNLALAQNKVIGIEPTTGVIKIDGIINEADWKKATAATNFVALRPVPFIVETNQTKSEVYFLYNKEGIFIGGHFYEQTKDSVAAELIGRDGFGNNDFVGIVFDTYQDKLNGFEYFVTPLGEQMDAKIAQSNNGNNEDFGWNAVWQSAAKIHENGWSFEMFLPYAAIRFGNKKIQDWGLNIVRRRQKSGGQLFWNPIDPNKNGFLTQAGTIKGLQDLKPPIRLQLSPYLSYYHDKPAGQSKFGKSINGGADIKYGLNQAFTLDMTLIPDFGQVVTDNKVLNLSPFEIQFNENRTFFTEGTELFSKGNLFYSRRIGNIGGAPMHYFQAANGAQANEILIENPSNIKLLNATKISGRTQKGWGVGFLNAVTDRQHAIFKNNISGAERKFETEPLTNYNVTVIDKTLKNNSSISFVNTNVLRNGDAYDANVSAALFDFNDKKNKWNVGGNIGWSKLFFPNQKTPTGYTHNIYLGKVSGRYNFQIWQDVVNADYDKSDLGYFTNNNQMIQGFWNGYNWNKPTKLYNTLRAGGFIAYGNLVSHIDPLKRKGLKFMGMDYGSNINAQLKNLWSVGLRYNGSPGGNDFYEPRTFGRFFRSKATNRLSLFWNSNGAKKYSWGGSYMIGHGNVFNQFRQYYELFGKIRFNSKFSIDHSLSNDNTRNQAGYAGRVGSGVYFSRRNVQSIENTLNIKYSFTNKMGTTFRARHYFSKVAPLQFYELDQNGKLQTPTIPFTQNVNQNYNFFSIDMVYTWQFAQGSFINLVWKNIGDNFTRSFEKNYFSNFDKTISGDQATSLSLRIIYFIDYLTAKQKLKK